MTKQGQLSELILNKDGSVYHLHLLPHQIAENIVLVGDPERVKKVSKRFDSIDFEIENREFITHTGSYKGKKFSVISTGIGTDNIDIVLNELNFLWNFDLDTRSPLPKRKRPIIMRLGTSGSVDLDTKVGNLIFSSEAVGLDGLAWFYGYTEKSVYKDFIKATNWSSLQSKPYRVKCSEELKNLFSHALNSGRTLTCTGFYHPQGRKFEEGFKLPFEIEQLSKAKITNLEMETAGIYLLSDYFGFKAISINALLANRVDGTFYQNAEELIEKMIQISIDILAKSDIVR